MKTPILRGVDVSHWQGTIDFKKLKESGIDFVMLKAGGSDNGFYTDPMFSRNYLSAKNAGLSVGAYYFVGKNFTSTLAGKSDAAKFYTLIKNKQFEMPVVLDIETTSSANRKGATDATIAFCSYLEQQKMYVSIYASDISGFKDKLDVNRLAAYDKWVAKYGTEPTYVTDYGMYQYTSAGSISGIKGNADLDYAFKDYPSIIKSNHLNGF